MEKNILNDSWENMYFVLSTGDATLKLDFKETNRY